MRPRGPDIPSPGLRTTLIGSPDDRPHRFAGPPLSGVFTQSRDTAYESARDHRTLTWQKQWWRLSGGLDGFFLRELCKAWSCTIESLLAPVAQRKRESGRGLTLVEACTDSWGWYALGSRPHVPGHPGKFVWCELTTAV